LAGISESHRYGWQQFPFSKNVKTILEAAKLLHRRTVKWLDHYRNTGEKLGNLIDAYNGSFITSEKILPAGRFEKHRALAKNSPRFETLNKG